MGSMKILDASGHTPLTYEKGTPEAEAAAAEFCRYQDMGRVAFNLKTKEKVGTFDPDEDLILVSPIAGG